MIATANYKMTDELLKQIWNEHVNYIGKGRKWTISIVMFYFLAGSLVLKFKAPNFGFVFLGFIMIVAGVYHIVWYFWTKHKWFTERRRLFKDHKSVEIRFASDRIYMSSPLSNSDADWSLFQRVVPTPKGMFLYPQPKMFIYIPDSGLTPLEAKIDILEKLENHRCIQD